MLGIEACDFPTTWNGTYYSSQRGDLIINSTVIQNFNTTLTGLLDYTCFMNSGSLYVIRSEIFLLHNALHRAYFCLEVTELTSASTMYRHRTSQNVQAYNERMKLYPAISSVVLFDICDDTGVTTSWEVLVKQGSESDAAVDCSNTIRGIYNYTIIDNTGTSCGITNTSLDVCTDTSKPTVNMTLCTSKIAYSAGGLLQCVYNSDVGSYSYTIVMNLDNSTDEMTTYRFTCLVSQVVGEYTYVSQYPQICQSSQTPTSVPVGGATLDMLPSEICPSTASLMTSSVVTMATLAVTSAFIVQYLFCPF
ncbi:hypothetical protein ACF0H5_000504 [Mactra antiquata]